MKIVWEKIRCIGPGPSWPAIAALIAMSGCDPQPGSEGRPGVLASSIGANEAVGAAADKLHKEMMDLSDPYNSSADAKPSKKKLEAAIKDLEAACLSA